jgi:uncharacterized protein YggT (Ycf19 family)
MGPVALFINYLLLAVEGILFLYVILSWVEMANRVSSSLPRIDTRNPIVRFIEDFAGAILRPIRRVLEPYQRNYPIDFSVLAAFVIIYILQVVVIPLIPF